MKSIFLYTSLICVLLPSLLMGQTPDIVLQTYLSGFSRPVDIAHANDDRLFIVEQDGVIRIIDGLGNLEATPFLDIDTRVGSSGNEQGLLGLAFHPNYSSNGFFYVNYTNNSGNTVVSRFSVTANPDVANAASELIIYTANQDFSNHNGGDLNFGPDGYLYIALGDGGSGGDPNNRAQNSLSPLGKMLRIDVDNTDPGLNYAIPATNPFVGDFSVLDEIWALGLRNPWRFSFDRLTGDMWIGDVGQGSWEEIDYQPASSSGGENYGWRCYEGNNAFNLSGCGAIGTYTFPVHEYSSNFPDGCSVTGGFVYRGTAFPNMVGKYFFVDYCSGRFSFTEPNGMGGFTTTFLTNLTNFDYSSFGEDQGGELYVAGLSSGTIFRIVDNSIVLPLSLIRFEAQLAENERDVRLDWVAESEINHDYYQVERSTDGIIFHTLSRVQGKGNETSVEDYHYYDRNPLSGNVYYRLKMVDLNGDFEYSSVAVIKVEQITDQSFNIFPNPVGGELNVRIDPELFNEGNTRLLLYNATGQLTEILDLNGTEITIPTSELPRLNPGIHVVILDNGQEQFYQRFIKM